MQTTWSVVRRRVFLSAGQEAFLEGHVHAFEVLVGVPFSRIRYDNLKSAVSAVLGLSRHRVENDRWVAFRSHYGIEGVLLPTRSAGCP
jgi:transposase